MYAKNLKASVHRYLRNLVELSTASTKHLTDKLRNDPVKVKLVAVAKDEAAYLPEWIAHHLYFGFDEIEIHINRTTDNTYSILETFRSLSQLRLVDGDPLFESYPGNPQVGTYKKVLSSAAKDGFTHLCFLDIDEFWVPQNLTTTVQQCITELGKPDVISFEWCNKYEPDNLFGPALQNQFKLIRAPQVKSIVDANAPPFRVNPHSIVNPYLNYKLADGSTFQHISEGFSRVGEEHLHAPIKPYFILHRYYRSELEYVAMLGKGRPNFPRQGISQVKSNRRGYADPSKTENFAFAQDAYDRYRNHIDKTLSALLVPEELTKAQNTVSCRYQKVLEIIRNSDADQARVLKKVLMHVSDEETVSAYQKFRNTNRL